MSRKTYGTFIFKGDRIVILMRKDGTFYLWNLDKKCYLSGLFPTEEPNTWVFDDKVNYYLLTKDDRGTFHIEEIGEKGTYKKNNEETTFKKEGLK